MWIIILCLSSQTSKPSSLKFAHRDLVFIFHWANTKKKKNQRYSQTPTTLFILTRPQTYMTCLLAHDYLLKSYILLQTLSLSLLFPKELSLFIGSDLSFFSYLLLKLLRSHIATELTLAKSRMIFLHVDKWKDSSSFFLNFHLHLSIWQFPLSWNFFFTLIPGNLFFSSFLLQDLSFSGFFIYIFSQPPDC